MKGMVVAPEPLASEVGAKILKKGGNAIDAAVAAAFVQGIVNPLLCGIGGSGLLIVHHAPTNRAIHIDCSCIMGSKPIPSTWSKQFIGRSEAYGRYILKNEENQIGYYSIMVPGFVMGAWEAFKKYGSRKISWQEIVEPSQKLASKGFEVYPYITGFWKSKEDKPAYPSFLKKLESNKPARDIYVTPKKSGEIFVQEEYGNTLKEIAKNGGLDFYQGAIGERMAQDFTSHDSMITENDIKSYQTMETELISGQYRGYEIKGAVSGSSSSPQIIAMLQILEGFDLQKMEHNSPDYIDLISRVMRASFKDHLQLKCDPPYSVGQQLLREYTSKERAEYWQGKIKQESVFGPEYPTGLGSETTHLSVVDENGSAVSWTHTLGSIGGSGTVTPDLGFLYNNFVGHFNPIHGHWDSILPGKRGGGGAPLLLYKDGELVMVIGAPGGSRIITAVLQVILNVIDHDMSMEEAVTIPRFHSEEKNHIFLEPEISENVEIEVRNRDNVVSRSTYMSRVQAILKDPDTGKLSAGADPRGGGGQSVIA